MFAPGPLCPQNARDVIALMSDLQFVSVYFENNTSPFLFLAVIQMSSFVRSVGYTDGMLAVRCVQTDIEYRFQRALVTT